MHAHALQVPHRRSLWSLPWITFLIIGGTFFIIEHDWRAQEGYMELVNAQSIDDIQTGRMFTQRAWRQAGGLVLFLLGALVFLAQNKRPERGLHSLGGLVLLFLAFNALSMFWADDWTLTFRRLVFFAFLCIGAAGVAARWRIPDIVLFTLLCTGSYLAAGVAAEIANGTFQPLESTYRFAGTLHPNAQAINCALLIFSAMAYRREVTSGRFLLLLIAIGGFAFVYLTKSRTALASTLAVIMIYWGLSQSNDRKVIAAVVFASLITAFFLLQTVLLPVVKESIRLGREEQDLESIGTLTGRTELWEQLWGFIGERPLLGYGYGGFWNEDRSWEIMEEQGWPISHSHNAYIDITLDAGPIAAFIYILILIVGIRTAYVYDRAAPKAGYSFFLILLLFCALNGLLESVAIQRTLVTFLSFVTLVHLGFFAPPIEYVAAVQRAHELRRKATIPLGHLQPRRRGTAQSEGGA